MWCNHFNCIISIQNCINRQQREKIPESLFYSFDFCKNQCEQGKKVLNNPNTFISRDVIQLSKKTKIVEKRRLYPFDYEKIYASDIFNNNKKLTFD